MRAGRRAFLSFFLVISATVATAGLPASEISELEAFYVGDDLVSPVGLGATTPTAAVAADLDEDGVTDLVCGYVWSEGQVLTVHRGNVDALYPHSPEAMVRMRRGAFVEGPFLPRARMLASPVRPDFLATGDFDNDGHLDVVVAAAGDSSLRLLPGDGRGALGLPREIVLPGSVTHLAAGDVHRADGLADLVVGVRARDGFSVLVFQGPRGALEEEPESIPVGGEPRASAFGRFAAGPWRDLAIASGKQLVLVRGRDRELILHPSRRSATGSSQHEVLTMPGRIESVAWGDFVGDSRHLGELGVLLEDGSIRALRLQDGSWTTVGEHHVPRPESRALLMRARLSRSATDDLVIVDETGQRIHLVTAASIEGEREDPASAFETGATRYLDRPALATLPMRLGRDALTDLILLQPGSEGPSMMSGGVDSVITVDTDLDTALAGDGACSLREALDNSNTDSDTTGGDCAAGTGADAIEFAIAGGGDTATIVLASALPSITDPVTIDGTTQGCASPPCVALDGSGAGTGVDGLGVEAGPSTIRGMAVNGFGRHGIYVTSSDNVIEGNFVGTDLTGTVDLGNNNAGVRCEGAGATGNVVGGTAAAARNVVAGNTGAGIYLLADANDNRVLGNYIGTDASGSEALGNDGPGVRVDTLGVTVGGSDPGARNVISGNHRGIWLHDAIGASVLGNHIGTDVSGFAEVGNTFGGIRVERADDNTIGGTATGARNVISGNGGDGVHLFPLSNGNRILGNFIGVDAAGAAAIGNGVVGVEIEEPGPGNNVIGGAVAGARNVISANGQSGVLLEGTSGNSVFGNYIGTDASGKTALGNLWSGVLVGAAWQNTIGGALAGEGNLISGNERNGIGITGDLSTSNVISGNCIGTDLTCRLPLGNGFRGVRIHTDASENRIGGTAAGEGNVIAHNTEEGVVIDTGAVGNSILGNSVYSNGLLGIDLKEDGVTANDSDDPDTGPNDLQNHPVLASADATPSPDVDIEGSLNSTGNETFRLEFFAGPACDSSGHGEGARYLGFSDQTTGGPGDVSFSVSLPVAVSEGESITATATNPAGSTSEFSACVLAACSTLAVFGETIIAQDENALVWATAQDVRFAKGDLAAVSSYATIDDGVLLEASSLDTSGDSPAPGSGLYYLVEPLGCGSWQSSQGAEPGRDNGLP